MRDAKELHKARVVEGLVHLVQSIIVACALAVTGQPAPVAVPVVDESEVGASFAREFPAHSLTVLRLCR